MDGTQTWQCVLVGEGTLLIRCADLLLDRGFGIQAIVAANPAIVDWARTQQVRLIAPGADLAVRLQGLHVDYLFSIANLTIIPPDVLALASRGAINFHDGPLPDYAGLYATSWALLNREAMHGVTWHEMREQVDEGAILKQRLFPIAPDETAFTLNAKCYSNGLDSFGELLDEILNERVQPQVQALEKQRYFGRYDRPPAAQVIAWNRPAEEIMALVHALDFGNYENPLGLPKLQIGPEILAAAHIEALPDSSTAQPGTVITADDTGIRVATQTTDLMIRALQSLEGETIPLAEVLETSGVEAGTLLEDLDDATAEALTGRHQEVVRSETFWQRRLASLDPIAAPYPSQQDGFEQTSLANVPLLEAEAGPDDLLLAVFALYLARGTGTYRFDLGWRVQPEAGLFGALYAPYVPLRINLEPETPVRSALVSVLEQIARTRQRGTYSRDVIARYPELKALRSAGTVTYPVVVDYADSASAYTPPLDSELALLLTPDSALLVHQNEEIERGFSNFIEQLAAAKDAPLGAISLLSDADRRLLFEEWNDTRRDYPRDECIHQQFERQAALTPDRVAVRFENQRLTYAELDQRANQLAWHLSQMGAGPDVPVGLYADRSLDLIVGLYGILKAGSAYVPLDPTYPAERLAYMIADAQVPLLLTQQHLVDKLPAHHAQVVCIDSDWPSIAQQPERDFDSGVQPSNLSYIIYTSGSTGRPKGVMVEHHNVVNFFAGMDERVPHDPPGTWLAVTSLSFDISALELFWTLARGFEVVLYADAVHNAAPPAHAAQPIDFSLYYFASDEGEHADDKYKMLIEGAKFADTHGFYAVWTPERHFHAFGGLYPNPSVASAALAMVTERVKILAGSVVLPLHSPIRVAEEWALVDNLSGGRVGISFASGWQPNDFVLMPGNYADRKAIMFRNIETVKRLWRGETLIFTGDNGDDVKVQTLPHPVQAELPVWVTAAGNPETFREAGANGFNLLTHLLGQSVDELAEKIGIYRQAYHEAGHAGEGHVTLMLHTFVGEDDDTVREIVRKPMKAYLQSAVNLIRLAAWSFPTFKQKAEQTGKSPLEIFDSEDLTEEDMAALLDHAFERYFETSGLFGSPETCLALVDRVKGAGVDEIACLIDYGVDSEQILAQLEPLNRVRELANRPQDDHSFATQVTRHQVTHMQCTPSMAQMLLEHDASRAALGHIEQLMIGGEAFPVTLADSLRSVTHASIQNMYGPTETTIWSSTHCLNGDTGSISIGRPIANTTLYVLDRQLQPVPVGVPGELFIGGEGVVRGYLGRPELTAERFLPNPFAGEGRMYRTGDLVRYLPDGRLEFLGRIDQQVKIRGYRIELGEIEVLLSAHPALSQAVVIAREDNPGDKRLVAYVIPLPGETVDPQALRAHLHSQLPEFMLPSQIVSLEAFPLTPNKKVDRKALPAPEQVLRSSPQSYAPPSNEVEGRIAAIWRDMLNLADVGVDDNFFDIGGHSLLAVRLHRQICDAFDQTLPITDIFRFPTIRSLAAHLSESGQNGGVENEALSRAERRAAMRRERRQRN